jgi:putative endonuclease
LDIIARDGGTTVFVEVKTREGRACGEAAEAVDGAKRRRMAMVALDYLARHHKINSPCRFDVVAITVGDGEQRMEVVQNAFTLDW